MGKLILSCFLYIIFPTWAYSACTNSEIRVTKITEERVGETFESEIQISASPLEILLVLKDMEKYPEFMRDITEVKVVSRGENTMVVEEKLDLPLGKIKRFRLNIETSEVGLSWYLLPWPELSKEEAIADTSGYWEISDMGDNCSLVKYHIYSDPGHVPFGLGWIVKRFSKTNIPHLLNDVRDRVYSFQ